MTVHQAEAFAILGVMLVLFASDRLRYDLVGALALVAAALTGIVPANKVFDGFSNPVIIIIAAVLVLSRAIAISGIVESAIRRIMRGITAISLEIAILVASVAGLSAFMKNVGTLGIFMPIAIQTAERGKRLPSLYLMPLAFGSLVGGTMTLIGAGPNLLISSVREQVEGKPFTLFDFMPVGLPLTVAATLFLTFAWRLIPKSGRGRPSPERQFEVDTYTSEATIPEASPIAGKTVAATLAHDLHYQPDAFLMAVALGASSDFLAPIGHQNNALVMSPGGYRFGDYWRLGLPLSVIVAVMGTVLIPLVCPLR